MTLGPKQLSSSLPHSRLLAQRRSPPGAPPHMARRHLRHRLVAQRADRKALGLGAAAADQPAALPRPLRAQRADPPLRRRRRRRRSRTDTVRPTSWCERLRLRPRPRPDLRIARFRARVPDRTRPDWQRIGAAASCFARDRPGAAVAGRHPHPSWAELLRRAWALEVLACRACGGRLRLLATIQDPAVVHRVLTHLGLPTESPQPLPACAQTSARIAAGRRLPTGTPRMRPQNRLNRPFIRAVYGRGNLPPPTSDRWHYYKSGVCGAYDP